MDILYLDTETFSETDIKTAGTVKYAKDTELLLCGFELNGQYDYFDYSEKPYFPEFALTHIRNGGLVCAQQALFDFIVLLPHIPELKIEQMVDSMAIVAKHGLPLSLEKAGAALGQTTQKHSKGGSLVRKFCIPRKPTKLNKTTRVHAKDAPEDWKEFRDEYLYKDVYSMKEIVERLGLLEDREQQYWVDTQKINLRGIPLDMPTVKLILNKLDKLVDDESTRFIRMVGLYPTQRDRVLKWVKDQGCKILNLQAATVESLIEDPKTPEHVKEALECRANTTHMSFKKYKTMIDAVCEDNTVKGTLLYHAASTGRFGGRLLQPQNLTRGTIDGNEAVSRVLEGEFSVELVKSCVRPMIHHEQGFSIADYSSIEARIVQWLARDEEALDVFRQGLDPYKWMAMKIYNVNYDQVTDKQRFTGKQAVLGLGYNMSAKKFVSMVESYGETISMQEAQLAVDVYRKTHKKLVQLWDSMNKASVIALNMAEKTVKVNKYISFFYDGGDFLTMNLPSGRGIKYYRPIVESNIYGSNISYMSMNEKNQYVRTRTYGGKLVENAVQGLSRDVLCNAIELLFSKGFDIITHIHDEIVVLGTDRLKELKETMCLLPEWAEGLPLEAEGFTSPRFIKG